jgi:hypothetical protein
MNYMNDSVIKEVRTKVLTHADTTLPMLRIKFSHNPIAGEATSAMPTRATITVGNAAGGSSTLRVTIAVTKVDEAGSATTTSTLLDGVTGGSGSPTVCATLGALIAALNDIDGITAQRLHAAADYPLTTNDFVDMAATDIPEDFMECFYRDVSEVYYMAARIGIPEPIDSGRMKLLGISGVINGATGGTVKVSRDPDDEDATQESVYLVFTAVEDTLTAYINDDMNDAAVYRGPLLIEVVSSDLAAANTQLIVRTVQAEY